MGWEACVTWHMYLLGESKKTKIAGLFFLNWPEHPKKCYRLNMAQFTEVSALLEVWRPNCYNEINKIMFRNKIKYPIYRNFKVLT